MNARHVKYILNLGTDDPRYEGCWRNYHHIWLAEEETPGGLTITKAINKCYALQMKYAGVSVNTFYLGPAPDFTEMFTVTNFFIYCKMSPVHFSGP